MGNIKKWLQDNPLGIALSAMCGLLLLTWLGLTIMASLPLPSVPADDATAAAGAGLNLPTLAENPPIDSYKVITERPLFNENRLPVLDDMVEEGDENSAPEEDGKRPEVVLAGVIITPSLRMVTLKRKDNDQSLVAFEGIPVEADFGGWQVSRILPRTATLRSASGEEVQLEMMVHDATIEPPARPAVKEPVAAEGDNGGGSEDAAAQPLSRAEEIRQRIAERREELRREAEQGGGDDQAPAEPAQPSYQEAIQSMIGRNRKPKSGNQNEQ